MRSRQRDAAITSQCAETNFSLMGEEGKENIYGVGIFKYLGRLLKRSDNDWTVARQNIRKDRQIWGRLGKILIQEGPDPIISAAFYHMVVQAVILFGTETWVLTSSTEKRLEGGQTGLLQQVTGNREIRQQNGY